MPIHFNIEKPHLVSLIKWPMYFIIKQFNLQPLIPALLFHPDDFKLLMHILFISKFDQRNTIQRLLFFCLYMRFSQSSHSAVRIEAVLCHSAAGSDRELSFINFSQSLMDASITFLKLVFVQSHTCMQIIFLQW